MNYATISRRALLAGAACVLAAPRRGFAASAAPKRIVATGAPVTEILFGLGCEDRIVAVDAASRFPRAARRKADAGYHDDLSPETLLALSPDLVVTSQGAGPAQTINVLAAASIRVVSVRDVRRPADIIERIRTVGDAIGESGRASALAETVASDLASVAQDLGRVVGKRRALILLGLGSAHPLIVGGAGTPAALALEMAGAANAAGHFNGWKALKDPAVAELEPEAIVALSIGAPLLAADVSAHPALKRTAAALEDRVAVADGVAFTGFGPRAAHVLASTARAIYPEAGIRPLPARGWVEDDLASL